MLQAYSRQQRERKEIKQGEERRTFRQALIKYIHYIQNRPTTLSNTTPTDLSINAHSYLERKK
jgi:hypothetical protein